MSIPKWNEKTPPLVIRAVCVGGPWKIVRGSPKFARTGCARSNGLTGHAYGSDTAAVAAGMRSRETESRAARTCEGDGRVAACAVWAGALHGPNLGPAGNGAVPGR